MAALPERETLLARTFVEIADTLVEDYDVVDMLTTLASRCVELFDVELAGLMIAVDGGLEVAASSSHAMHRLELLELQHEEGPCVDSFRTGTFVSCEEPDDLMARWPTFAAEAIRAGIASVAAVPMRLRDETIGSLNLLRASSGNLTPEDRAAAQAVADAATIGILQYRTSEENRSLAGQLRRANESRRVIEQARSALTGETGLDVDAAFDAMREYARRHRRRLADVAAALVYHQLSAREIIGDGALERGADA